MSKLQRTQILLEADQHRRLTGLAASEGRSLSELVRESVGLYLTQRDAADVRRQALGALARLAALRDDVEARLGTLPGSGLAALRSERGDELDERQGNPT